MQITSFSGENSFLSNFHPTPLTIDGITFPTVEHAFQAAKTHHPDEKQHIANQTTPGKAKRAGRKVQLRPDWEKVKVDIMLDLVELKFKSNPDLMAKLIATGDAELIEGNNWNDTFWGVCRGKGKNMLGKILEVVRNEAMGIA